jgi:ankyrin repeat protein
MAAIKATQVLMLIAGFAAFLYGAYELGQDVWFRVKGVPVEGHVIGHGITYEIRETFAGSSKTSSTESEYTSVPVHRPTIRYRWPPENGEVYIHHSSVEYEGDETDLYDIGNRVRIWVLPGAPDWARLPGGFTHYLWAGIGLVAGLFALVLVSWLFFLHEGLFGRDISKGTSLFRSVKWSVVLLVLIVLIVGIQQFHQRVAPWLGLPELTALVTGDIGLLSPLLAAKGEPEPGRFLNEAERSFARLPLLGEGFACAALERALRLENDAAAGRYLAAMADPTEIFPVRSDRALVYAAIGGKAEFVKALLDYGVSPDTTPYAGSEPLREATSHNRVEVMELLLAAGARTDYPVRPLLVSAIEGRAEDAARLLIARTTVDVAWREPQTGHTLADLALLRGMMGTANLLEERGTPVSLPRFYRCAVSGDLKCLARELPAARWKTTSYGEATLLHLAARHHQPTLARALIARGADPNAQIRTGSGQALTPLIEAVLAGDEELMSILIKAPGIRLDRGDYRHITPLAYAIREDRWDLAERLVEAGANVNIQVGDYDGNTLLHLAAERGDLQRVQWLLARGADHQMRNYRQLTPLDVARTREVIDLLRQDR